MINRSIAAGNGRPRTNARLRTKDLEHVIVAIDDAESYTDRHNMMNFLVRDTRREVPVGYEKQPKNYIDPEVSFGSSPAAHPARGTVPGGDSDEAIPDDGSIEERSFSSASSTHGESPEGQDQRSVSVHTRCARKGCTKRPRFDSLFCSDGCGILAMEMDLLLSFQDAGELHPSVLRLN
jgi:hypothetical protein